MTKFLTSICFIVAVLIGTLSFASAQDFQVGQQVVLQAKKSIGVPLHREPAPSYLKHVPSGTTAVIQSIAQNAHWLSIQLASGDLSWVHKKYVQTRTAALATPNTPLAQKAHADSRTILGGKDQVWTNTAQCQLAIQQGLRMAEPSSATLRVATWQMKRSCHNS